MPHATTGRAAIAMADKPARTEIISYFKCHQTSSENSKVRDPTTPPRAPFYTATSFSLHVYRLLTELPVRIRRQGRRPCRQQQIQYNEPGSLAAAIWPHPRYQTCSEVRTSEWNRDHAAICFFVALHQTSEKRARAISSRVRTVEPRTCDKLRFRRPTST